MTIKKVFIILVVLCTCGWQVANTGNKEAVPVNETLNCPLFPADNIWNAPVDTLPLAANSTRYINTIGADDNMHADFGSGLWDGGPIGIPFTTVPGSQQKVTVTFDYDDESDPGPYPIPADAPIEGGSNSDGDRHVLVVDRDNCILYELYDAHPQGNGSWTAGSGAIFDLNSNDLRPDSWTSADAAGLPILAGLVRYEEVAAGEITHAIRVTAPQTRRAYVWPARHYASSLTGTRYPPMGQRFRLKADFDISGFSSEVQVILRALKKYGMILADNGSSWFISGVPDERWDNDDLHELHNILGSDLEAVDVSSLMVDPDSAQVVQPQQPRPEISLDRDQLNFGAVVSGTVTGSQTFMVSNSGDDVLNWTAGDNSGWLSTSPSSGTDSGIVHVSVDSSGLAAGSYTGTVTITDSNASNSPQTVTVNLTVLGLSQDHPPLGGFDTPVSGSTVSSSIAVTGWALDDIGVESVKIYRQQGNGLVYIGDALFVEGARPDIETAYPDYPLNYKSGWGYMMLTNFLPNNGNGTFVLYAVAADGGGQEVTLGTTTITCDNDNAVKPFGAIDTPLPGSTVSGGSYRNHGWVLTPLPNSIPTNGSTIDVYVDGVNLGHPVYNIYRSDIAGLFPGYANSDGAHAYLDIDTTAFSDGVHTIAWSARDSDGNTDGIGSRYFTIENTGIREQGLGIREQVTGNRRGGPVWPPERFQTKIIDINECERLELPLTPNIRDGFLKVGEQLRPLPIGSTLDRERGIFYWLPGPGFIGEYEFIFITKGENRITVTVKINIYKY